MLTYTSNNKKYYLNQDGVFTENFRQVLPIEYIPLKSTNLSFAFYRIKCFNKYYFTHIPKSHKIKMEEFQSDNNLMFDKSNDMCFMNSVLSVDKDMKIMIKEHDEDNVIMEQKIMPYTLGYFNEIPRSVIKVEQWLDSRIKELFVNGYCNFDLNVAEVFKSEFERAKVILSNSLSQTMHVLKLDVCFQRLITHPSIKKFLNEIYEDKPWHLTSYNSPTLSTNYNIFNLSLTPESNDSNKWHVEYPYNTNNNFPMNNIGVQMIIAIDDIDDIEIIKFSHALRINPVNSSETIKSMESYTRKIPLKKGSIFFLLGSVWNRHNSNSKLLINFSPVGIASKDSIHKNLTFLSQGLYVKDNNILFA
jgi:hypothetical protein